MYFFVLFFVFFFFKQKTAYEMRISDWSSDVCSSDLEDGDLRPFGQWRRAERFRNRRLYRFGVRGRLRRVGGGKLISGRGAALRQQIGRASWRERVCQYVSITVAAVPLNKNTNATHTESTMDIDCHTLSLTDNN